MATKIRLQRHGKKHQAFFHIVVADGRSPQQGRFIEKIGTYNPKTNPATIEIDFDKTLAWLQKGAEPTDTARAILSYKGVLYKNHLLKGVTKKALTPEQAEAKFQKWIAEKEEKISGKKTNLEGAKKDAYKKRMDAEAEAKAKRQAKIAAKTAPPAEEKKEEAPPGAENTAPAAENTAPPAENTQA